MKATCHDDPLVLGDYVDGALDATGMAAVEAHLLGCDACRALAHDLRVLRAVTRDLEALTPPPRVWAAIAATLERPTLSARPGTQAQTRDWHRALRGWQPLAAAAGLIVIASSVSWLGGRLAAPSAPETARVGAESPLSLDEPADEAIGLAEAQYADAIASLEAAAIDGAGTLDDQTTITLQTSVETIDGAIGDSRAALLDEPTNEFAQASLLDAMRSKVALLQDTLALIHQVELRQ